jgi:hypothetical protein
MPEHYTELRERILAFLAHEDAPVASGELFDTLQTEGVEPALVALLLSDLVNNRQVALDRERRLSLVPAHAG